MQTVPVGHVSAGFRQDLLTAIPRLRAFATTLSGQAAQAEDLVQETLVKAWANAASFIPDTNMIAWLCTILRNEFYTGQRRLKREVRDENGDFAARLVSQPDQESHLHFVEFRAALAHLGKKQREALILVGAMEMSYEEAAEICGCAVGTIKSRVNRAREKLAQLLTPSAGPIRDNHPWNGWGDSYGLTPLQAPSGL